MTRRSILGRTVAVVALLLSGAVHALVLAGSAPGLNEAPPGGGGGTEIALLGNGFADLAQGTLAPVAPAETGEAAQPVEATAALAPVAEALDPVVPAVQPPVPAPEPLTALPDPAPRPQATPAAKPKPAPKTPAKVAEAPRKTAAAPQKAQARGNADHDARRGAAQGSETGQGTQAQGAPGNAGAGATASPARYAATVIRKIRAVPQHRGSGRGTALVGFEIAPGGGLARITILRSSGSAPLDAAALDHIRRAAPFPPPPAMPARFSFEFSARG
ncbi:TonB family protein [Sinirhodobacter ferrireducens]|uniref:TonB family protein n=1 Tax=Paenirhodobacter ferrireducens TaxID=1215032 RepID=A0A443LS16_9RHOB|nr:energy transducer TonB [Sinirhodobacter ferrireducens]RWR51961.1 TonB family protein [Sinirhodobacter ferrireducens]